MLSSMRTSASYGLINHMATLDSHYPLMFTPPEATDLLRADRGYAAWMVLYQHSNPSRQQASQTSPPLKLIEHNGIINVVPSQRSSTESPAPRVPRYRSSRSVWSKETDWWYTCALLSNPIGVRDSGPGKDGETPRLHQACKGECVIGW